MSQRNAVDAVAFIVLGTLIATNALLLVSSQNPSQRLKWFVRGDMVASRDPIFMTLTLVGLFSVIWGGTGLHHHTPTWLAGLLAIGPLLVLRTAIVLAYNMRVVHTSEMTPSS